MGQFYCHLCGNDGDSQDGESSEHRGDFAHDICIEEMEETAKENKKAAKSELPKEIK